MDQRQQEKSKQTSVSRSLKRKLGQELESDLDHEGDCKVQRLDSDADTHEVHQNLIPEIRSHVDLLNSTFSSAERDRAIAKSSVLFLYELAKDEEMVDVLVECGAVPALVRHLKAPPLVNEGVSSQPYEHEVEKRSAATLGLLAVKTKYQQLIADAGAIPLLVDLLKRHKIDYNSRAVIGVIRRAADAISSLAHENSNIKTYIRIEGAIPLLVEMLEFCEIKVQRAAAAALRNLTFKNDGNKNKILECNALPTLVQLLQSEDQFVHCEAVGVIGNMVHSSPQIKQEVILAGALQPVIGLLSSGCLESQREAALLIGQFAAPDSACKAHIAQRGGIVPLIQMLQSPDIEIREMSSFALGRLAQDTHNQAGIAYNGGIAPLLKLLESKYGYLKHNAAFTLYGIADNEDNVVDLIKVGGIQKLQEGEFSIQQTKECVAKTLNRLGEKIHGRVLNHLLYLLRVADKTVKRRVALTLAHLCADDDCKTVFVDNNGLGLLLELLESTSLKEQCDGSTALHKLATRALSLLPVDAIPPSPRSLVYLSEMYVNNSTLSDVTFLVEGKPFYAHRISLVASSDTFRAMFDGGYRERDAKEIEIPNIKWDVFELMMRYIYTGTVDIDSDVARALLVASDQYLLEGLKLLCESAITKDISSENILIMYELSDAYNAASLRQSCILFILEQFDKLSPKPWYSPFIHRIRPEIHKFFIEVLSKAHSS